MIEVRALAPHIPDLSGKTICGAGHSYEGDEAIAAVVELLKKQYRGIKFIPNSSSPMMCQPPKRSLHIRICFGRRDAMSSCRDRRLRELYTRACAVGIAAELAGIPAVTLACSGFVKQAVTIGQGFGFSSIRVVEYPGHISTHRESLRQKNYKEVLLPGILKLLTRTQPGEKVRRLPNRGRGHRVQGVF